MEAEGQTTEVTTAGPSDQVCGGPGKEREGWKVLVTAEGRTRGQDPHWRERTHFSSELAPSRLPPPGTRRPRSYDDFISLRTFSALSCFSFSPLSGGWYPSAGEVWQAEPWPLASTREEPRGGLLPPTCDLGRGR